MLAVLWHATSCDFIFQSWGGLFGTQSDVISYFNFEGFLSMQPDVISYFNLSLCSGPQTPGPYNQVRPAAVSNLPQELRELNKRPDKTLYWGGGLLRRAQGAGRFGVFLSLLLRFLNRNIVLEVVQ